MTSYNCTPELDAHESDSCDDEETSDNEGTSADESESSVDDEEDNVEAMQVDAVGETHVSVKTM